MIYPQEGKLIAETRYDAQENWVKPDMNDTAWTHAWGSDDNLWSRAEWIQQLEDEEARPKRPAREEDQLPEDLRDPVPEEDQQPSRRRRDREWTAGRLSPSPPAPLRAPLGFSTLMPPTRR